MPDSRRSQSPSGDAGAPSSAALASSRSPRRRRGSSGAPKRLIDMQGPDPDAKVEDIRLTVGMLVGSHGVQGELRMTLQTDAPEHLLEIERVYLGDSDTPTALEGVRFHGDSALIFLEDVETPEEAKALRGTPVRIAGSDARPLEEGEYFYYQLVGLRAVTPEGDTLGVVVDMIETGAHDVLVIAPEGSRASRSPASEVLIPHHESYVHEVDPKAGTIVVTKPVYSDEVNQQQGCE
ncbi:MAG TPA: ribosome maturation factor RimM [Thermomicrobiales bacterium]|nr:ribosome maturation factor RimM [Thermomicrobiales bacterium]